VDLSLQILLFFAILIVLAKAFGDLAARFGFPVVLGELLVGLILGPTFLGVLRVFDAGGAASPGEPTLPGIAKVLANLGAVVLMFLAGLETDIPMMKKAVGPAFWAACGGVLLPMGGGALLGHQMGFGWAESIFIGTILTATSVSITAQTLMNMNELRSRAGSTILGAAVIDDVLGLVILSFVTASAAGKHAAVAHESSSILLVVGRVTGFLVLGLFLGPYLVRAVFKRASRLQGPHSHTAVAFALAMTMAFLAEYIGGMAAITGAYLAGYLIAAHSHDEEVVRDVRSLTHTFFAPIFLVSIGLSINARSAAGQIGFFLAILAIAIVGKVVGCGLGAFACGFGSKESLVVGVGMIPRGEVGLITASLGWTAGIISSSVYTLMVVMVLVTTLITPVVLRLLYPWEAPVPSSVPAIEPEADTTG
jgi:Kef-type K+ transport system membrane component KefB